MEFIKSMIEPINAQRVHAKQLLDAERLALEHQSAAEEYEVQADHHERLAVMYRARVERLRSMAVGT